MTHTARCSNRIKPMPRKSTGFDQCQEKNETLNRQIEIQSAGRILTGRVVVVWRSRSVRADRTSTHRLRAETIYEQTLGKCRNDKRRGTNGQGELESGEFCGRRDGTALSRSQASSIPRVAEFPELPHGDVVTQIGDHVAGGRSNCRFPFSGSELFRIWGSLVSENDAA